MIYPSIDFGGSGSTLVFLHANGYPPSCYKHLLLLLATEYHVTAFIQRPLWKDSTPGEIIDWHPLTEDLLQFLAQTETQPIIGIGHSMGGIALLRAALDSPELFRAIVMIDPVLFPPSIIRLSKITHALKLEYRTHPLIPVTLKRRQHFTNLDLVFKGFRQKQVFKYLNDQGLSEYIQGITCPDENGYRLCYPAEWESRIYATSAWHDMDIWRKLPQLTIPTLIIRGKETDTFWSSTARMVKRKNLRIHIIDVEKSSHLVPLERPDEVSEYILSFLEETL